MNIPLIGRLFRQNILWLILLPAFTAFTVFYFTRKEVRSYQTKATLYTGLASGYSILTDDRNTQIDHQAVDNEFDNLLSTISSRETMTQVGLRLLSRHLLLYRPDSLTLGNVGFQKLQRSIPADLRATLTTGRDEQLIYQRLDSMANLAVNNPVKRLLTASDSWYGPSKISKKLLVNRKKGSDIIELTYESEDPAVTYHTLTELINVFTNRYTSFKSSETNPVVQYYSNQKREATRKLQQAESRLKAFEETNKIINFDEESKGIAATKEELNGQYNEELMKSRAAKASLAAIGSRLEDRLTILKTNEDLVNKRNELTSVSSQLAQAQVYGRSPETIRQLSAKATQLSDELKTAAQKYYKAGTSIESLPQAHLLDEWLTKLIQTEESSARLKAYEKRLQEFDNIATKFAPLGATLVQLKRDINVAEKDYLTTISALNQAQTRQKNAEMTGPLRLLDEPEFPTDPLPSKRILLIASALVVGLILALLLALIRYLADKRIYDANRFKHVSGLSAVAAFPTVVMAKPGTKATVAAQYMLEQLRSTAAIEIGLSPSYGPYTLISVWSTRPGQGKTWLTTQLAERYGLAGKRVALLHPHAISTTSRFPAEVTSIAYTVRHDFAYARSIDHIVNGQFEFDPEEYDIVLLELPDLNETPIATQLVAQSNALILVTAATSTWGSHDQNLYQLYRKATNAPILPVLNHVALSLISLSHPVPLHPTTPLIESEPTSVTAAIIKNETAL